MLNYPKIEGIIIDFDGTLAGKTHEVSPRVKKAIEKAREKVKISLCTGRPYKFVASLARDLGLDTLHVAEGGGRVVTSEGAVKWERLLPEAFIREAIATAERESLTPVVQIHGEDNINWHLPEDGTLPPIAHIALSQGDRVKTEALIQKLTAQYPEVHVILSHYLDSGKEHWLVDITAAGANKQHALLHLAQLEGLNLKNFMAIGDGYNDFPLLAACGFKVAMGNAHPELKAIADFVAPTVDEDGVAHVIEKFILE